MTEALTWIDGKWQDGSTPIFSGVSHAVWLSSLIFDGARSFEGVAPDLDLHCQRALDSAMRLGMRPEISLGEMMDIAQEGIAKYSNDVALYIRPTIWAEDGFIVPNPDSTKTAMVMDPMPMPAQTGFSAALSQTTRRPLPSMAPTDTKAACLYPNAGRAIAEAKERGFQNAVVMDGLGNIAEFASANLFMVKDGIFYTPAINGTFLNGITRQRVIALLRSHGSEVKEQQIQPSMLLEADEIFSTGNYGKVMPVHKYEDKDLVIGDGFQKARDLYWNYSHS